MPSSDLKNFWLRSTAPACLAGWLAACGTVERMQHTPRWRTESQRAENPLPVPNQYGPYSLGQEWNPVWWWGNADDPEPPDWYRPDDPRRKTKWYFRNPLHNFTFYVIGLADQEFTRVGPHPGTVFNPDGGWTWAWSRARFLPLPYVSYRRDALQFYFGWRERGNFGIKLKGLRGTPAAEPDPIDPKPAQ